MDNDMIYKMFLNTLSKMNDEELDNALKKAKELLSESDYEKIYQMIEKERLKK